MTDSEVVLVGAAGTGKSLADLLKMHRALMRYPGARALIVRKVRADLAESTLVTYERDVLGYDNPICAGLQRQNRQVYTYPNGSVVVVGGMDRPGRVLSAEYDLILVPEAVQLTEEDWETLVMRNRATVMPYQQIIGDTNPDRPDHWVKQRADRGLLKLLTTYHTDNAKYWDAVNGCWTADGEIYVLGKLSRLSGVRKLRYLDGKWVLAEGAVYDEWNDVLHVIDRFDIPASWRRIRAIDFGFTNPFVCQWWAIDPDGRMYLYREIYKTQKLVEDHADDILRLTARMRIDEWQAERAKLHPDQWLARKIALASAGEKIEKTLADHDAEDRATLRKHGIVTDTAQKEISVGIQAVQGRLRKAGDGRPRLFVFRDARVEVDPELLEAKRPTSTIEEFPGYVWAKTPDGKPNKEEPVDLDNHGMDTTRYAVRYVDRPRASISSARIY